MTITTHPNDETVRIVTEESEIVSALQLRDPFTRAVFFRRPELTKLFTAAGVIVARRDENVLFRHGDYFRNPFAERYEFSRKLDLNGKGEQVLSRATEFAITMPLEIANAIFDDIKKVYHLQQRVFQEYMGEPSFGRLDFNVVAKGEDGCTPKMHIDMFDLNAHVSYLTPLQWLSGVPTIDELAYIADEALESSAVEYRERVHETQIGDVAFIKGLGPMALDAKIVERARFATMPHRSSDKIRDCGQIAVAIF